MNKDSINTKLNRYPVIALLAAVVLTFIVFEFAYMPHDYDNLGGKHVWVSGSTIKFANMWLEEGAARLHFTNYELFPSIEYETMEDRQPYVSYPTGVTFMVWAAAKLCGRNRIDVSFLKHYQMFLYGIETIMMTLLIYVIVSRMLKRDDGEAAKTNNNLAIILVSYLISVFWLTLPVNNWFMTNIFWTDIAVLLWVIAFLLLESVSDFEKKNSRLQKSIVVAKAIIIFAGVMTEYFFCIVVFVAFVLNAVRKLIVSEKGQKIKDVICSSLQYVIPVFLGIGLYIWQMSYTDNWLDKLLETFLHRTGVENNEAASGSLIENFSQAITCGSRKRLILFAAGIGLIVAGGVWVIVKRKLFKQLAVDRRITVLGLLTITPVIQIFVFSNHSAIHQYAMVKVGFVIIGLLMVMLYVAGNIKNRYVQVTYVLVTVAMVLLAMGYPGQTKKFYSEKNQERNYDIAEAIYRTTDYSDVCVSYSYFIDFEPPMDISVSEKCVYDISGTGRLEELANSLPKEARIVLVIDKNNIGSNNMGVLEDKTEYIVQQETMYAEAGDFIHEDDKCLLVDITKCVR